MKTLLLPLVLLCAFSFNANATGQTDTLTRAEDIIQACALLSESTGTDNPVFIVDGKTVSRRKFKRVDPLSITSLIAASDTVKVETDAGEPLADTRDTRVNIGYGVADSRDLSYSVGSVKSRENEVYNDMYEYLRGRVAGVQVGTDKSITIRGINSINSSTQPLILLDGVEINDLSLVNPYDVYSVDVLKDSSAAIYGMKGANGVILITTKAGQQVKEEENAQRRQAREAAKAARKAKKAQKNRD